MDDWRFPAYPVSGVISLTGPAIYRERKHGNDGRLATTSANGRYLSLLLPPRA